MSIELKSISTNERLSEETPCYSAKLYWNGAHVASVANHGHGGPDMVDVVKSREEAFRAAVAYIKALPPVPSGIEGFGPLAMDLELWCHLTVEKEAHRKTLLRAMKKDLKSAIVFERDGKIFTVKFKGVKVVDNRHVAAFKQMRPEITTVLNDLPEALALRIYAPLVEVRS
jgi:hypothetical protein